MLERVMSEGRLRKIDLRQNAPQYKEELYRWVTSPYFEGVFILGHGMIKITEEAQTPSAKD